MGVLQAWPGRATWVGRTSHGVTGLTAAMARQMTSVPQWSSTRAAVRWFASFDAAHGWGVNLLVVVLLVGVGVCLLIGTRRVAGLGVVVGVALCLATWLLVQDLGFFGGVGTDPNSMVPTASLLIVGYLALRYPATARADDEVQAADAPHPPWRTLAARSPAYLLQVTAAVLAGAIVVLGAAPMAVASLNPHADPILAEATNGTPVHADFPAFGFDLVDQEGRMVTLSSLHGHVVVLTFFDPVCTTDCPLIAQQLLTVDRELQGTTPSVVFVAIDANPSYRSLAAIRAFDAQEGLTHVANWRFLTGSLGDLNRLWIDYGVQVSTEVAGAMAAHADLIYVIDQHGNVRSQIASDPGATAATTSSLGSLVTSEVERVQGL
jgi:cytochrome oxidase Cu insertion factor (SCO1/SenC/PrrC family)